MKKRKKRKTRKMKDPRDAKENWRGRGGHDEKLKNQRMK